MDSMALVDTALAVQNAALHSKVETAVLRKTLDAMEAQGAAMVEMLEDAARLSASAPGRGDQLNIQV